MNDGVNVLDLSWNDLYNAVVKSNITQEEFNQYLLNLTNQAYKNGYDDCDDDKTYIDDKSNMWWGDGE